jgi:deoxyadenosine/deoxycytidine kinase
MLTDLPRRHRPTQRCAACLIIHNGFLLLAVPAAGTAPHSRPGPPSAVLPSAVVAPGSTARRTAAVAAARATGQRVPAAQLEYLAELYLPPGGEGHSPAQDLRVFAWRAKTRSTSAPSNHPHHRWAAVDKLSEADLDPDTGAVLFAVTPRLTAVVADDAPAIAQIEAQARRLIGPVPAIWRAEAPASVVVLGPPAVGKTTLLNQYASENVGVEHVRDIVPVTRGPGRDNYLTRYLVGDPASAFFCQMETLLLRILQNLRTGQTGVLDQDVHSSLAYAKALRLNGDVSAQEYETYYRYHYLIASALPPPAAVVHLTAHTDVLMRRMRRRNRVRERSFSSAYVALVAQCFEDVAEELSARVAVHHIDASALCPDEVLARFRLLVPCRPNGATPAPAQAPVPASFPAEPQP